MIIEWVILYSFGCTSYFSSYFTFCDVFVQTKRTESAAEKGLPPWKVELGQIKMRQTPVKGIYDVPIKTISYHFSLPVIFDPCLFIYLSVPHLFSFLSSHLAIHLKFTHQVMYYERQTKFDVQQYLTTISYIFRIYF